jgi:polysaccharide deacetylase family protein (PEP-CTERM system associated)
MINERPAGGDQPAAREVVNAFSVDVEDYFQVAAFADRVAPDSWSGREYRAERNTEAMLQLLEDRGVKATFFILGWVAERSPQLVRRICAGGHEVASHGYSHQLIYRQTPQLFREETVRSKALIEDASGSPVVGYRAASFSITSESLWALDVLVELGFLYDSSIFPIHHDRYGIPNAPTVPGAIESPSGGRLVEFPMAAASIGGIKLPVSGGGYFRLLPYWLCAYGLRQINRERELPFTFYIHPWEIDPGQPRLQGSLLSRFRHYTGLSRCESKLRQLLADFRFGTMRQVLQERALLPA